MGIYVSDLFVFILYRFEIHGSLNKYERDLKGPIYGRIEQMFRGKWIL